MRKDDLNLKRVWLEISLDAIVHNFKQIQKAVYPAKIMAVLKADAYGLGAIPIAKTLSKAGASRFGVAEAREALILRKAIKEPIQILSGILDREISACVQAGIICPISDFPSALALSKEAQRQRKKVTVHIKIDTGMGRLGIPHFDAKKMIPKILSLPGLHFESLFSHFTNANNPENGKTLDQIHIFNELNNFFLTKGIKFPLIHLANSDGINNFPKSYFNMVRTGINLYGVFDLLGLRAYHLSPTLTLKSTLMSKRKLPAGYTIGYGCTHVLFKDTLVGTIPAGYADGVPLAASNSGFVLIRGKQCPIIGRISMDYLSVDLNSCPSASIGDDVVLIGRSGKNEFTIEDWARIKQTHPYDIICSLGRRVERVYLGREKSLTGRF